MQYDSRQAGMTTFYDFVKIERRRIQKEKTCLATEEQREGGTKEIRNPKSAME
jgi:hypothetical protein